jgi:hypothetical protein
LVDDEAVDGHRVPGQIDGRDVELQPSRYLQEYVAEQPPDVWHGDPPLMAGMPVQPVVQRH